MTTADACHLEGVSKLTRFRNLVTQDMWYRLGLSIPIMFCFACVGCSPGVGKTVGVYQVRGSVTVNGEPAEYANVLFTPVDPDGQKASAVVDTNGEYRLTTQREFDGAEPGEYRVSISWAKPKNPDAGEPDYGPELLPKRYLDPLQSGLKAQVEATDNTLDPFEIQF
jgi:hypothetical protein